ncbi:2-C-methyl-D-erythritol 2,4-cyclodiphosphate synthase [Buchnera aphidicola (Schlechtendalia chinensis)]|uniref:2-C-methyl-D-erythritol 2,4-cyclodiphosphate synthase n=1 Tax=Buchnera aphidicola subsp. Schlechtendalia chinensis TaxID=118110 RepID=A0A172WDU2_BUCSC|nr:2-C-methyl-D-erythritol 2,4-cyclodiphosphate synthase [Buchnera aphidicola]ANF17143.1 2-C-methyl-D-erythritol 2,4-cyclodiphosphate synthase [Buchnera aphidicola (Schlechtendalia chinensis)]
MRIGHGFDVHAFGGYKPLIIGGVIIPYTYGLIAHSDGDVVVHTVIDALIGASALGDIGSIFPNTKKEYKNVDSRILLRTIWKMISKKGYVVSNIDITVIAQAPKMSIYRNIMRKNVAMDILCSIENVSVKYTTTEKLGFIGRKEGVACESVVMLKKRFD